MTVHDVIPELAAYADDLHYADIDPETITHSKLVLLDALACAIPAREKPPVTNAIKKLAGKTDTHPAQLIAHDTTLPIEYAAFINASMIRYLDWNDTYISRESGHPSSNIGALLAITDAYALSGEDFLTALVLAYEIQCRLTDAVSIREYGFDHTMFALLASTIAGGKLINLTEDQLCEAAKIALIGNIQSRQSRKGNLTEWKNFAVGNACRNALVAVQLADAGIHGPEYALAGDAGFSQMTEPFSITTNQFGGPTTPYKINHAYFKLHPVCYHIHGAIDLLQRILTTNDIDPTDITNIHVETYDTAITVTATPEKFDPDTRETADHSLPYCLARTLTDGTMGLEQYTMEKITDPSLRDLMNRITIEENPAFTDEYGDAFPVRIELELANSTIEDTQTHPKGHYKNPASPTDIKTKFHHATTETHPASIREDIIHLTTTLEDQPNLTDLFTAINTPFTP